VFFSEGRGHLTELARNAVDGGATLLVFVGGDGSLHEVADGIVGRDVEVAVLMRGTGMDFARTYGISTDAEQAFDIALHGDTREIDVGRVTYHAWAGGEQVEHLVNVGSVGMSADTARRSNTRSKALGGKLTFFLTLVESFLRWRNVDMRVRVGDETRSGKMTSVVVANGQYHGGSMWLAPEAQPDDGLLDVVVIGDINKADFVRNVGRLYKGTHLTHPKIDLLRGPRVEVDADQPVPLELDGEQPGTTPVAFEIVPRALRIRVPR
jgi:YegS/Rv2252/BmrU family lipid kinase